MFSKNEAVTLFQNWDRKGTVKVTNLYVYSCGKKQMILVDDQGVKFGGRNFLPTVEQHDMDEVHPVMTDEAAEAHALEMGARIAASVKARKEAAIAHYGKPETDGYTKAVRRDIAELHEPRCI